ncbi:hypothetical protein ANCCAN_02434 [Ancylostoma caninum]|uniref:Uncharacterized protein n=1 Tax=Ancylostoma caninum TaxID=29170 RepID=A0A368H4E8_ANCCA|nr:hypothetical protein ANCCAN_02434 [Ancylostoma caninum]
MFRRSDFRPPKEWAHEFTEVENVEEHILERHRERLYAAQLEEQESNSSRNEVEKELIMMNLYVTCARTDMTRLGRSGSQTIGKPKDCSSAGSRGQPPPRRQHRAKRQ